jgi:formiminotetrahydrofolate cyclodeaminase
MKGAFLEELSKPQPNPGGGAAAAYGASVAVALLEKITRLELNRHSEEEREKRLWERRLERVRELAESFSLLREEDVQAYMRLAQARTSGMQGSQLFSAIDMAIRCPAEIMEKAHAALLLLSDAGKECGKHLVSDLQVAGELLKAAMEGAFQIGCANLALVHEVSRREQILEKLSKNRERAWRAYKKVAEELALRSGLASGASVPSLD